MPSSPNTVDLVALVTNARSLRPNTRRSYLTTVKRWIAFVGDDPSAWTPQAAQRFYETLLSDKISVRSANNMITGGLAYASNRAHVLYGLPNFAAAIDKAREDEDVEPRHALTAQQAQGLLAACGGGKGGLLAQRDHAICIIGLFTGMRRAGLVDLRLENVRELSDVVLLEIIIKGGKSYEVPIAPRVWARLDDYRAALGRDTGPLLPRVTQVSIHTDERNADKPMTADGLYKALNKAANRVPIKKFHPHIFRHTFATWCRQAKIEDYLIEVVTGHKSNRGLVDRVYTDHAAMYAEVVERCAAAIEAKINV